MLIKVLLADRQQLTVEGIRQILTTNSAFTIVGVAYDIASIEQQLQAHHPDILVLDYHTLKDFSPEYYRRLISRFSALKVFVITAACERAQILQYLEMGVVAFLTKDCSKEEIASAFSAIARGQKFYCNRVLDLLVENQSNRKKNYNGDTLSEREITIIQHIARGLSTSEMATEMCLSPHTINSYRKGILKKLEVKTPVEMIVKAFRMQILEVQQYL